MLIGTMSTKSRAAYIERVRRALETDEREMTRAEYIDALEELSGDIDGHLDAARTEEREAQGRRR